MTYQDKNEQIINTVNNKLIFDNLENSNISTSYTTNNSNIKTKKIPIEEILSIAPSERENQLKNYFEEIYQIVSVDFEKEVEVKYIIYCSHFLAFMKLSKEINHNYLLSYIKLLQKSGVKIELIVMILKNHFIQSISKINFDKDLLLNFIREYELTCKIFSKFELIFDILNQVKDEKTESLKYLFWLLFICLKRNQKNLIDILILMISMYLKYLKLFSVGFNLSDEEYQSVYNKYRKNMLSIFSFSDNNESHEKLSNMTSYISREIVKLKVDIKFPNLNNENLNSTNYFSKENSLLISIQHTYTILLNDYEFSLKPSSFDESIVLSNLQSDRSPVKTCSFNFIPLNTNETSFRKLNFKTFEENSSEFATNCTPTLKVIENRNEMASPNALGTNAYQMLTPFTRVVSLNKWVTQYIKTFNEEFLSSLGINLLETKASINFILDKVYELILKYDVKTQTSREEAVILCLKLIDGVFKKNFSTFNNHLIKIYLTNTNRSIGIKDILLEIINNQEFLKSIVFCTYEMIFYIENINDIYFFKIAEKIELEVYSLLKIINPVITFDLMNMPNSLRYHFSEIEVQILQFLIFSKKSKSLSFLKEYLNCHKSFYSNDNTIESCRKLEEEKVSLLNLEANKESIDNIEDDNTIEKLEENELNNQSLFMFLNFNFTVNSPKANSVQITSEKLIFIKILNYMLLLSKFVLNKLKIGISICLAIEKLIKKCLLSHRFFFLFVDKHLDQIVLCCISSVLNKLSIEKYEELIIKILDSYEKVKQSSSSKSLYENLRIPDNSVVSKNSLQEMSIEFSLKLDSEISEVSNDISNNNILTNFSFASNITDQTLEMNKNFFGKKISFFSNYSAYNPKFVAYYYFYKTVFIKELNDTNVRNGCTPLKSSNIQNLSARTSNVINLYNSNNNFNVLTPIGTSYNSNIFLTPSFNMKKSNQIFNNSEDLLKLNSFKLDHKFTSPTRDNEKNYAGSSGGQKINEKGIKLSLSKRLSSEFSKNFNLEISQHSNNKNKDISSFRKESFDNKVQTNYNSTYLNDKIDSDFKTYQIENLDSKTINQNSSSKMFSKLYHNLRKKSSLNSESKEKLKSEKNEKNDDLNLKNEN